MKAECSKYVLNADNMNECVTTCPSPVLFAELTGLCVVKCQTAYNGLDCVDVCPAFFVNSTDYTGL